MTPSEINIYILALLMSLTLGLPLLISIYRNKHAHPGMEDYKANLRSCPWCHAPLHYRAPIAMAHLQWCHGRECAHFGAEHGGWAKPHEKRACKTLREALEPYSYPGAKTLGVSAYPKQGSEE